MRKRPGHLLNVILFAGVASIASALAAIGHLEPQRALVFAGLTAVASLAAAFESLRTTQPRTPSPVAFAMAVTALLAFGPAAMTLVAAVVALSHVIAYRPRANGPRLILLHAAV